MTEQKMTPTDSIMSFDHTTQPVGTHIDRTMKLIRWNYLQAFKQADVDITTEQWVILDHLFDNNGISQSNIANDTFKNAATVSRIIDLLCKKKYLTREKFDADRRRYRLFLTDEGNALVKKLRPIVFELRQKGWEGISEKDYFQFIRTLEQVYSNFSM